MVPFVEYISTIFSYLKEQGHSPLTKAYFLRTSPCHDSANPHVDLYHRNIHQLQGFPLVTSCLQ